MPIYKYVDVPTLLRLTETAVFPLALDVFFLGRAANILNMIG